MRKKGTQEVMGLFLILMGFLWLGDNTNLFRQVAAYTEPARATIHVETTCSRIWGKVNPDGQYTVDLSGADYKKSVPLAIPTINTNGRGEFDITYNFPAGDFLFSGSSCNGRPCANDSTWPMFSCAGSTPPPAQPPVTPPPSSPPCVPNCNCAGTTYTGQTCMDGCGGYCPGTAPLPQTPIRTCWPDCSCAANTPAGQTCPDGCGGVCPGYKQTTTAPSCTPNCGDTSSRCVGESWSNGCGGLCYGAKNCSTTTTTTNPTCTTATWKGGSVSSTNVIQGEEVTLKCDYGLMFADNISAYLGDTKCTWLGVSGGNAAGWNGTAAIFKCPTPNKGVVKPRCEITAGGNMNVCTASSNYVDQVDIAQTTTTTPTDDPTNPAIPVPTDNVTVDPRIVRTTCGNIQGYAKAGTKIKFYLDHIGTFLGTTTAGDNHIFSFDFTKYPLKHKIMAYEDCSKEGSTELCRKEIYNKTTNANMFTCGDISQAENPKIKITGVAIRKAGYFGEKAQSLLCGGMYNIYVVQYQVSEDVKADWDANKIYQMSLMADYDDPRYWSDGTFRQLKTNDHGSSLGKTFGEFLIDYCPHQTSFDPATYKPKLYVAANYDVYRNTTGEIPNVVSALYDTKNVPTPDTSDFSLQTASAGSTTMIFYAWGEYHFKFYRSYLEDHSDKEQFSPPYNAVGNHWVFGDSNYDKTKSIVYYQVAKEDDSKASNWLKVYVSGNTGYNPGGGTGIGGQILNKEKILLDLGNVQGTNFNNDTQIANIGEAEELVKALVSAGVILLDSSYTDAQRADTVRKVAEYLLGQGGAGSVGSFIQRLESSGGTAIGGQIGGIAGAAVGQGHVIGQASAQVTVPTNNPTEIPDTGEYSEKLNKIFKDINIFEEGITVADLIKKIINLAMALAGLIALAFIIYGGYMYIMSAGSPDESKKAMQAITQAAIGLVLVLAAWLIISAVINVFKQ